MITRKVDAVPRTYMNLYSGVRILIVSNGMIEVRG